MIKCMDINSEDKIYAILRTTNNEYKKYDIHEIYIVTTKKDYKDLITAFRKYKKYSGRTWKTIYKKL